MILEKIKPNKKQVVVALILVVIVGALYYFRSVFVAATVNGHQISRVELIKELEKEGGSQALDALITKRLILDEAKKQNIKAEKADIDKQIVTIEEQLKAQDQTLESALAVRGMTRQDLEDQLEVQVLIQKLLEKEVTITDEEVDTYIKENKSTDSKDIVKETLKQQKLADKFQTWIDGLKTNAKINYFVKF